MFCFLCTYYGFGPKLVDSHVFVAFPDAGLWVPSFRLGP